MPEFYPVGKFTRLILYDAGYDGQMNPAVLIEYVDVVAQEEYAYASVQQFSSILDEIERVADKAADFLGDDEIKYPGLAVTHHVVEVFLVFGIGDGKLLVDISLDIFPDGIFVDQVLGVVIN